MAECRPGMTPAELRAWQAGQGLSALKAAAALGVSYATYRDWVAGTSRTSGKTIKLPPMLGLACAAIAAGLSPLSQTQTETEEEELGAD